MRCKLLSSAIAMAAFVALSGCSGEAGTGQMPPPPEVSVAAVLVKDIDPWDEFTGNLEAVESVALHPRVNGYIERVGYTEGSEIAKGQVLFTIDPRSYRAALARAEAELESARAAAALARVEIERARKLADARAISIGELDQRKAALDAAEAGVRAAQAAVDAAALDLEFTEVRSPIAGRAGRAMVTAGNLVSPETLLTTIVSIDPVHVYFESDERIFLAYEAAARAGGAKNARDARRPVRVGLAGETGYPHKGELDFVDNRVDPATGTLRARAVLPNPDRALTPGLFARVQLLAGKPFPAMLIDEKAVLTDQDRKYVYVVGEDGTAQRRDVRLGRTVEGLRVVESGLADGDRVIVHGVQKVFFPGMPVQARPIAMGDPPPAPAAPGAAPQ